MLPGRQVRPSSSCFLQPGGDSRLRPLASSSSFFALVCSNIELPACMTRTAISVGKTDTLPAIERGATRRTDGDESAPDELIARRKASRTRGVFVAIACGRTARLWGHYKSFRLTPQKKGPPQTG